MKTKITYNIVFIVLFVITPQFLNGQITITKKYKYTVENRDANYTFEVEENKNYYCLRYDTAHVVDTVFSELNDNLILRNSIRKVLPPTLIPTADIEKLATILYLEVRAKKRENELLQKLQDVENDKGDILGFMHVRKKAKAYLLALNNSESSIFSKSTTLYKSLMDDLKADSTKLIKIKKNKFVNTKGIVDNYLIRLLYRKYPTLILKNSVELEIDTVEIAFENGIIKDILVVSHNKTLQDSIIRFSNLTYFPIRNAQDIDRVNSKERNYLTYLYKKDSVYVIDLSDVIDYGRRVPFTSGTYIPKDTTIRVVNNNTNSFTLRKPSITESFDARIYSDMLGFDKNASNGIIQFEGQLDIQLNQGKNKNSLYRIWSGDGYKRYRDQWLGFNRISPYFKVLKVEESKMVYNIENLDTLNFLDVFKHSNLDNGLDLNLATYRTDSKQFTFNVSTGILRTSISKDSLINKEHTFTTMYFYPNIDLKFFNSNKIEYELKFGVYYGGLLTPNESLNYVNQSRKLSDFVTGGKSCFYHLQQSINLHPNGNKLNSLFLRTSEYIGKNNNYFTFQIGYATSISNLLRL